MLCVATCRDRNRDVAQVCISYMARAAFYAMKQVHRGCPLPILRALTEFAGVCLLEESSQNNTKFRRTTNKSLYSTTLTRQGSGVVMQCAEYSTKLERMNGVQLCRPDYYSLRKTSAFSSAKLTARHGWQ